MDDADTLDEEKLVEQKVINEEYKIWKKNAPLLYDFMLTKALEWPTLTVQWLPDKQTLPDKNFSNHRLLIGTNTSGGAPNYLQIANIQLPTPTLPKLSDYNEEAGEFGGYTGPSQPITFDVIQKIPHPEEVNKARYQPQNPNLIATCCPDGVVRLWDRTKHSSQPDTANTINPQAELRGHTEQGFGLDWSLHKEGQLATGAEDNTTRIWDVTNYSSTDKTIAPTRTFTNHSAFVNNVQHHPILPYGIGSVSDDKTFALMDLRTPSDDRPARKAEGHTDAVNALAFHPTEELLFATGSADSSVKIWDIRNLKMCVATFETHRSSVTTVEWSPFHYNILASSGDDRRVLFWDCSKVGDEQTPEDAMDGPPELSFMHAGHTNSITEFSWNKTVPWAICSASEDNLIEIWMPARPIVGDQPKKKAQPE
ncbi:MAG: Histone acetyltransferase type B subunit 2 [Bogoriella megaspora]|nr:MAG: Histone acetyltransferase type B subunit 2 [Bogoriella megaspora]